MKLALFLATLFFSSPLTASNFRTVHTPIDGQLPYFLKQDMTPIWDIASTKPSDLISMPKFSLESQLDKNFENHDIAERVTVLNFFFASCGGYCPGITRNMRIAFDPLKESDKVTFVSLSVTPNIDQPEVLTDYANRHKINDKNWHLVRGNREAIYDIGRNHLYADIAVDISKGEDQFVHSESVYLMDQKGFVRGIYNGNVPRDMKKMLQDMELLGLTVGRSPAIHTSGKPPKKKAG